MRLGKTAVFLLLAAVGVCAIGSGAIGCGPLAAETPDLSGTWKLNEEASTVDPAVVFAGLGGSAGVPRTLYVTHARNGTVIIGSDMNTSHARTYEPGRDSRSPLGGEVVAMTSRWDGATLVAEGVDTASQDGLREALTKSSDGTTLTVEIQVTIGTEVSSSLLVYEASTTEPSCVEWPTPCKDFSGNATP